MHKAQWVLMVAIGLGMYTTGTQGQHATTGIYSCIDAKGHRLTADRPIAACSDRDQKLMMPSGAVRTIGPSYSEQERAEQAEDQRRKAEERYRASEDKRRELALAARYPTRASHDTERNRVMAAIDVQVQMLQKRRNAVLEERQKISQDTEFYRKDPTKIPPALRARQQSNRDEVSKLASQIASLQADAGRARQHFDNEAQTLAPYWK